MRIAIVACDQFKRDLEFLTSQDKAFVMRVYLGYDLHDDPKKLKQSVIEQVNALEGQVDAVLLGYGDCGSLRYVSKELKVPTVQFKVRDCIAVYLTQEIYDEEKKKNPMTYYSTPYFSDMDLDWHHKDWNRKMGMEMDDDMFMSVFSKMFDGYSRSIYVHTFGEMDEFVSKAKKFADDLHLNFETREGDLSIIKEAITLVKELAEKVSTGREENI